MKIINAELRAGVWTAEVIGGAPAGLQVLHDGLVVENMTVTPQADRDSAVIRVPVPADLISDGVQTFIVTDATGGTLASFAILAGEVLAQDIRAEIDLLRAELDLLKAAFRRHCSNT